MATIYVGPTSAGLADGTSWANRYGTLNAAEDRPIQAGDTVYVGPGTYRELLTVDVSGTAGNPITYIGDYTGANTDSVGGVVRITGSDNDQTITRANCITATSKDYRTFRGFVLDSTSPVYLDGCTNVTVDQCHVTAGTGGYGVHILGAAQSTITVSNCYIFGAGQNGGVLMTHTSTVDNTAHVVSNCIINGAAGSGVHFIRVGGATVRNCIVAGRYCIRQATAPAAGQTNTINNCVLLYGGAGFIATATGELTEDYNCISLGVETPRSNTNAGAHSNIYLNLNDTRWFFELVAGGKMLSPWDLASYSQLVNVAGTSPTTADMRGTTVQGTQREWGALEYDSTLYLDGDDACDYPAAADVESGVTYGSGVYTGTFTEPGVGNVESGVTYGGGGVEFTGTFGVPAVGDVQEAVQYGAGGTEFTGTFGVPTEAQVESGVGFGEDDTEFTGTLVAGGGGPVRILPILGSIG